MQGILIAAGPAFRSGIRIDGIDAVDIYNLLALSMGLTPAENQGDESVIDVALELSAP